MHGEERAHVQHQRSFRITNRLILIRRQVMWSSNCSNKRYRRPGEDDRKQYIIDTLPVRPQWHNAGFFHVFTFRPAADAITLDASSWEQNG